MTSLLDLPLRQAPLAFIDVETTGLDPTRGHRVVEVAVVRTLGLDVQASYTTLLNPQRSISAGAARVNGISLDMVANSPRFAEVLPDLLPLLTNAVIVAHNAPFDLGFLEAELQLAQAEFRAGLADPAQGLIEGQTDSATQRDFQDQRTTILSQAQEAALCTLALARRQYHFFSNSLTNVANALNIRTPHAHRALADVEITRAIFRRFSGDLIRQDRPLIRDWLRLQGGPTWRARFIQPARPDQASALADDPLQQALLQNQRLHIHYRAQYGRVTERVVQPLNVSGGYLVAYCYLRQEERTFRLDRILEMRLENQ